MNEPPDSLTQIPPLWTPVGLRLALRAAWDMPWKARNEIERILIWPWVRLSFALAGVQWGRGWKLYGAPLLQVHRRADVTLGEGLQLRSARRSNPLVPVHPVLISARRTGAVLRVGRDFAMTGGMLVAEESITIGDRVQVGANTAIVDTDFHPLDPDERRINPIAGTTRPIVIEDDVFIGMRCLILKGARLGAGCVIGAGSVVTGPIPPGVIAAGNPAKVIRRIRPEAPPNLEV